MKKISFIASIASAFLLVVFLGGTLGSVIVDARVPEQTPPAPYGLIAYWVRTDGISWSWAPSSGVMYYEFILNGVLEQSITAKQIETEGLKPNTQYSAAVRACNEAGCSALSASKAVYTQMPNAFYLPNNRLPVTTNSITLWLDGSYPNLTLGRSGIDHAVFPYDGEAFGGTYQQCDAELHDRSDAQQNNNPVVFSGLAPSTCYMACGYPTNGDGAMPQNPFNRAVFATRANQPGKASPTFINITANQVKVQWSANGNPSMAGNKGNRCPKATEYRLHNITRNSFSSWFTETSYQDVKLLSGKQYCYEVKARNAENVETSWVSLGCARTSGSVSDKFAL